jgi:hypothetical protein
VISHKISQSVRTDIVGKNEREKPGPGHYEDHMSIGKDAKSFRIGEKAEMKHTSNSPGPGAYSPTDSLIKSRSVKAHISKSIRKDHVSKEYS